MKTADLERYVGKALDGLRLPDRLALTGCWVATELYSPERLPLRAMAAVGRTPRECIEQLQRRGLDPSQYHYEALAAPFEQAPNSSG